MSSWYDRSASVRERIGVILGGFQDTTLFLTLAVWLCAAPFVLLLTLPFFGWQGGVTATAILFLLALAACWGICQYPKPAEEVTANDHRSGVR